MGLLYHLHCLRMDDTNVRTICPKTGVSLNVNRYRVVPPHIYISLCVLSWGIIASLQAVTNSFGFLFILRALLGLSEAAFAPGIPFYLSFFYRRRELAFRTGLVVSASPLSASFAGALAYGITKIGEHTRLNPWRLLFLVEGLSRWTRSRLQELWIGLYQRISWKFDPSLALAISTGDSFLKLGPKCAPWSISPRRMYAGDRLKRNRSRLMI